MRLACFHIPLFPLAARLRSEPELQGEALAIVDGSGNASKVIAASKRARKFGIRPGLSLAQSRAIVPSLIARGRDEECERAAQEALLDLGESLSPRVEDAGEGVVYLDLGGLSRLYEKPETGNQKPEGKDHPDLDEQPLASSPSAFCLLPSALSSWESDFAQRALLALEHADLPARIGIGSSKLTARIAAELPDTPTIVPPGEETRFLAPLPLSRLAPELEIGDRLDRWGIRSIGDFAGLPEREIASRLGETGRALHNAARGRDSRPLIPRVPPPDFREGMDLEWPLIAIEPFLFVANAALDRLTARLAVHGLACRRLVLRMKLEPEGFHERSVDLPAPTRDVKTLLTLTRLDLEEHPPGAPVIGFVFIAEPDQPRTAQLSLYGPLALSPDKLATTIARLAALVGADRVGTPLAVDSHRPERFALGAYDPPAPPKVRREAIRNRGLLAVRVLRPAAELEVKTGGRSAERGARSTEDDSSRDATKCHPERSEKSVRGPEQLPRPDPSVASLHRDDRITSSPPAPNHSHGAGSSQDPLQGLAPDPDSRIPDIHRTRRSGKQRQSESTPLRAPHTAHGAPTHIRAIHPDDTLRIDGSIRIASGPWQMEEGWWSDSAETREYWDVELERGGVYRIYQNQTGKWFADGVYD